MRTGLLLSFLIALFSNANASILIDPYVGFLTGSSNFEITNNGVLNGKYEYSNSGTAYGLRLGATFDPLFFGVGYEMGSLKRKISKTPNSSITVNPSSNKFDTNLLGLFVGAKIPMFRFWGAYYLDSEWKYKDGTDTSAKDKVSGFGVGVGFTGLPIVSINLEYRNLSVSEIKAGDGTVTKYPASGFSKHTYNDLLISLSVPFEFL